MDVKTLRKLIREELHNIREAPSGSKNQWYCDVCRGSGWRIPNPRQPKGGPCSACKGTDQKKNWDWNAKQNESKDMDIKTLRGLIREENDFDIGPLADKFLAKPNNSFYTTTWAEGGRLTQEDVRQIAYDFGGYVESQMPGSSGGDNWEGALIPAITQALKRRRIKVEGKNMDIKTLRRLIREELKDDIYRQCPMCDGSGKGNAREGRDCPECNGSGHVLKKKRQTEGNETDKRGLPGGRWMGGDTEVGPREDDPYETRATPVTLGHLYANIGGDRRYTDYLKLTYDPSNDTATVTVSSTGSVGGMDSFAGTSDPDEKYRQNTKAGCTPKDVMQLLKFPLSSGDFNFRQYGKPTKNFTWDINGSKGLSIRLVSKALEDARDSDPGWNGSEWDD